MNDPKLYVLATPLGNREDVTVRAVELLKKTKVIFAEDTREARKLLEILEVGAGGKTLHSYASHNMKEATDIAVTYLREGFDVILVSDRGTPALSDPGAMLVEAAREAGFEAYPIPGPSALAALWSVAGISEKEFAFLGFLSEVAKERTKTLDAVTTWNRPVVFFESPNRIRKTLEEFKKLFPDGRVFLAREMTKAFEEYRWWTLATLDLEEVNERGEYTVCLVPNVTEVAAKTPLEDWVKLRLMSDKDWSKAVSAVSGLSAKDLYNALQEAKRSGGN